MNTRWLVTPFVLGAVGVIVGAMTAHLDVIQADARAARSVHQALEYLHLHSLLMIAIVILSRLQPTMERLKVFYFTILVGILLFCGSILTSYLVQVPVMRKAAPIGGSLLILSWLGLATYGLFSRNSR